MYVFFLSRFFYAKHLDLKINIIVFRVHCFQYFLKTIDYNVHQEDCIYLSSVRCSVSVFDLFIMRSLTRIHLQENSDFSGNTINVKKFIINKSKSIETNHKL